MAERLAKSLSGHDKGRVYMVIKEDKDFLWLADGELKTIQKPKKKNKKHIQIINNISKEIANLLDPIEKLTDLEIKRAIKLYRKIDNDQM